MSSIQEKEVSAMERKYSADDMSLHPLVFENKLDKEFITIKFRD